MRCALHSLPEPCADCAQTTDFAERLVAATPLAPPNPIHVLEERLMLARHHKAKPETIKRLRQELAEARRSA